MPLYCSYANNTTALGGDIMRASKYGYNDTNFMIEDKMTYLGVEFIKQFYPTGKLELIPSYTNTNRETKHLQDKGIDAILHLPNRKVYIDFKCYNREYFTAGLIELQRKQGTNGIPKNGWVYKPMTDIFIHISYNEILIFNKASVHKVIEKYPSEFNPSTLKWNWDSGNKYGTTKKEALYKRNKLLFFDNKEHIRLLQEMKVIKYHLFGSRWVKIPINELCINKGNII